MIWPNMQLTGNKLWLGYYVKKFISTPKSLILTLWDNQRWPPYLLSLLSTFLLPTTCSYLILHFIANWYVVFCISYYYLPKYSKCSPCHESIYVCSPIPLVLLFFFAFYVISKACSQFMIIACIVHYIKGNLVYDLYFFAHSLL